MQNADYRDLDWSRGQPPSSGTGRHISTEAMLSMGCSQLGAEKSRNPWEVLMLENIGLF